MKERSVIKLTPFEIFKKKQSYWSFDDFVRGKVLLYDDCRMNQKFSLDKTSQIMITLQPSVTLNSCDCVMSIYNFCSIFMSISCIHEYFEK